MTMTPRHRLAFPVLLTAAFASGCGQGSGATLGPMGAELGGTTSTGTGGETSSTSGNTSTGTGGDITSTGGSSGTTSTDMGGISAGGAAVAGMGGAAGTMAGGASGNGAGGASAAGAGGGPMSTAGTNSGAGPWGTPVAGGPTASGTMVTGTVTVDRNTTTGNVGAGFAGFSVEKTHLTNATLTSKNAPLIALFKLIGPTVIRVGANDVDRCTWTPAQGFGTAGPPYGFNIGTTMVDGLNDFLDATGARVIYGVNFFANNVPNTAAEATYAQGKLAAHLYGFEVGNEIDKYGSWTSLKTEWESFATAITGASPNALLIGPAATGGASVSLSTPFAQAESAKFGKKLVLLTQHYYVTGAGAAGATVAGLQTIKGDIPTITATMNTAATSNKIPDGYRFGEVNSFSGHGQMGVSDTLIAGLWAIDLMFVNAVHGASGVNFHGGETGMDGTRPFYYEPIMENNGVVQAVMPVYYGMLFTYLAGQGPVLATTVTSGDANLTAYAINYKADGSTSVVLDNKNATTGVQVTVNVGTAVTSASAIYLQGTPAGSLTAAPAALTLAGAQVTATGTWARHAPFIQTTSGNTVSVFVPPASAALVRVQ